MAQWGRVNVPFQGMRSDRLQGKSFCPFCTGQVTLSPEQRMPSPKADSWVPLPVGCQDVIAYKSIINFRGHLRVIAT